MEALSLFVTILAVLTVLFAVVAYGSAWLWWRSLHQVERMIYGHLELKLWPAVVGVLGAVWLIARWFA